MTRTQIAGELISRLRGRPQGVAALVAAARGAQEGVIDEGFLETFMALGMITGYGEADKDGNVALSSIEFSEDTKAVIATCAVGEGSALVINPWTE